jgi:hypothetical protein
MPPTTDSQYLSPFTDLKSKATLISNNTIASLGREQVGDVNHEELEKTKIIVPLTSRGERTPLRAA